MVTEAPGAPSVTERRVEIRRSAEGFTASVDGAPVAHATTGRALATWCFDRGALAVAHLYDLRNDIQ